MISEHLLWITCTRKSVAFRQRTSLCWLLLVKTERYKTEEHNNRRSLSILLPPPTLSLLPQSVQSLSLGWPQHIVSKLTAMSAWFHYPATRIEPWNDVVQFLFAECESNFPENKFLFNSQFCWNAHGSTIANRVRRTVASKSSVIPLLSFSPVWNEIMYQIHLHR